MPARRPSGSSPDKLSTTVDEQVAPAVDDSVDPIGRWWATVIPKRHARRAVTRNLIDRQVLAALQRAQEFLPAGQWLLRLRSPLPRAQFPSADSQALRSALRHELDTLLARCRSPKVS